MPEDPATIDMESWVCPAPLRDSPNIVMGHGGGGAMSAELIEHLFLPAFGPAADAGMGDSAVVDIGGARLAFSTDSFVVKPMVFPGGTIGDLAVNGTVNDLAMAGARPEALTLSLILEEGLESDVLRAEVDALARAAEAAGVRIVGGDTKVVERGHADGMYITTTGLGRVDPRAAFETPRPGDRILLSGPIAAHGTAIMLARGEFDLEADIVSDTRSLWPEVDAMLGPGVRTLRDATRGGVASVLNELARAAGVAMLIQEKAVPVAPAVAGACELLGIDPMHVANEGVFVAIADGTLPGMTDIGEIRTEPPGMVLVETAFGGRRVMDQLVGDPLPRIC
jgi:hydrogenase expression/formation protein HypE